MSASISRLPVIDRCRLLAAALVLLAGNARAADACLSPGPEQGRVADVDRRLALRLEDGRRLRLAGLEAPAASPTRPDWPELAANRLKHWLVGRDIRFQALGAADRWGLLPARVFAGVPDVPADTPPLWLEQAVLGAGLARAVPLPEARGCFLALRAAESDAREAGLGVWGDPYYAVLAAEDREALATHAGSMVVTQGRVLNLGTSGPRTYLNFGTRRGSDLSVIILKQNLPAFEKAGWPPARLVGKSLRLRGLVDVRFGPQIELLDPEQMEVLEAGADAAPGETR